MAQIVQGYQPNRLDRPDQRRYAFPVCLGQQLSSRMFSRFADIPYFEAAHQFKPVVLIMYARGRCILEGWPIADNSLTVAALEMVARNLPVDCFLEDPVAAREMYVRSSLRSLLTMGYENIFTTGLGGRHPQTRDANVNDIINRLPLDNIPDDVDQMVRIMLGLELGVAPNVQPAEVTIDMFTVTFAQAIAIIIDYLASHSTIQGRSVGCNLYTLIYVSAAKRGTITNAKLAAINRAVSEETTLRCDISTEDVHACGRALTTFINETNAQSIMTELGDNISQFSLRLQITVSQTARAGMTSYWCIQEAIRLFPNFGWDNASRYIPDDFVRYQAARQLVDGNEYYGFRRDLGPAAGTNYKSLAWLAIELLIRFKGSEYGSLGNYRGRVAWPDREQELRALVEAYVPPANPQA